MATTRCLVSRGEAGGRLGSTGGAMYLSQQDRPPQRPQRPRCDGQSHRDAFESLGGGACPCDVASTARVCDTTKGLSNVIDQVWIRQQFGPAPARQTNFSWAIAAGD